MFKLIFWPLSAIWVIGLVAMIVRLWYFQIVLLNNMAQSEVRLNSAAFLTQAATTLLGRKLTAGCSASPGR